MGPVVAQAGVTGKAQSILQIIHGLVSVALGIYLIVHGGGARPSTNRGYLGAGYGQETKRNTHSRKVEPFAAGLANGLIPCALVFSIAIKASQASLPHAALLMLVFGLDTLPALLSLTARPLDTIMARPLSRLAYGNCNRMCWSLSPV